jgi:hypothetical protein
MGSNCLMIPSYAQTSQRRKYTFATKGGMDVIRLESKEDMR